MTRRLFAVAAVGIAFASLANALSIQVTRIFSVALSPYWSDASLVSAGRVRAALQHSAASVTLRFAYSAQGCNCNYEDTTHLRAGAETGGQGGAGSPLSPSQLFGPFAQGRPRASNRVFTPLPRNVLCRLPGRHLRVGPCCPPELDALQWQCGAGFVH